LPCFTVQTRLAAEPLIRLVRFHPVCSRRRISRQPNAQ
jgi:hypothetical protein